MTGKRPISSSVLGVASCRRCGLWGPVVVQVVQDSVVRAPQKMHAPLTTTVNSGSLRSVENADGAATICEGAGRGVGPFFCQGEGRGFELSRRALCRPL
jgi:hypothetical protein